MFGGFQGGIASPAHTISRNPPPSNVKIGRDPIKRSFPNKASTVLEQIIEDKRRKEEEEKADDQKKEEEETRKQIRKEKRRKE
ncbi:hypothetical protein LWI29_025102 [Acer saccharum]|uniref:Uncharacterized protein n=1 Tax=Acer saccharum TaxID=4024 RepID=A0AA39RWM2_ACESA|nr:hypothetical protein LWI29_025102 [Acer saccharum]